MYRLFVGSVRSHSRRPYLRCIQTIRKPRKLSSQTRLVCVRAVDAGYDDEEKYLESPCVTAIVSTISATAQYPKMTHHPAWPIVDPQWSRTLLNRAFISKPLEKQAATLSSRAPKVGLYKQYMPRAGPPPSWLGGDLDAQADIESMVRQHTSPRRAPIGRHGDAPASWCDVSLKPPPCICEKCSLALSTAMSRLVEEGVSPDDWMLCIHHNFKKGFTTLNPDTLNPEVGCGAKYTSAARQ